MAQAEMDVRASRKGRWQWLGDALASGGLSLIFPHRPGDPLRRALTKDERSTLLNALADYAEWAADAANDKRTEAEQADPPDEGLDAEADYYEQDRATAIALIERLS